MVTRSFKNLSWLYDFIAMETTVALNSIPQTTIFLTTFIISDKNDLYTIFVVAMVTKFNSLSWFYDFVAMETAIVQNNFPKTTISFTTFFISIKKGFYTILVVAMVTNMTNDTKWHTLCHLVSSPLLCHLVSCGGPKWHNDTKWSNYTTNAGIPRGDKTQRISDFIDRKYVAEELN